MAENRSRRTFLKGASATTAGLATASALGSVLPARSASAKPHLFDLYFMIPNNEPARMAWGTLCARQMTELGIHVIANYVPFTVIIPRRNKGNGATYVHGGWDAYLERYYYDSITPLPNSLFEGSVVPPNGPNYYYVNDPVINKTLAKYASSPDPTVQKQAMEAFEKRWYDTEPLIILFYPDDLIAVNPKLKGFDSTTFQPVFYPRPENWTLEGRGRDATASFACWPPPDALLPMYTQGYMDANGFGPVYNCLLEYDNWQNKKLVPALATDIQSSADGKRWVIQLRKGVKWHDGEPFTAEDVKFTWDTILNPAYVAFYQADFANIFGSPAAYSVTGSHEITVNLPQYSILFRAMALGAVAIMPKHAYEDISPQAIRGHTANTFLGTYTVPTSSGAHYTAHGGIGTGPWIAMGYDPVKRAYKYIKNENYWRHTPGNVTTFWIVNIEGTDACLAALKSGAIDCHDPMYDISSLVHTINPSWGKVLQFDSFKWQHLCFNLRHPVFGTGTETPLGKKDPSRAFEAAAYVRRAISYATPRSVIVDQIAKGYGHPGTVPIPWSSPFYDHKLLKPIPYNIELAKSYMEKAGYKY